MYNPPNWTNEWYNVTYYFSNLYLCFESTSLSDENWDNKITCSMPKNKSKGVEDANVYSQVIYDLMRWNDECNWAWLFKAPVPSWREAKVRKPFVAICFVRSNKIIGTMCLFFFKSQTMFGECFNLVLRESTSSVFIIVSFCFICCGHLCILSQHISTFVFVLNGLGMDF